MAISVEDVVGWLTDEGLSSTLSALHQELAARGMLPGGGGPEVLIDSSAAQQSKAEEQLASLLSDLDWEVGSPVTGSADVSATACDDAARSDEHVRDHAGVGGPAEISEPGFELLVPDTPVVPMKPRAPDRAAARPVVQARRHDSMPLNVIYQRDHTGFEDTAEFPTTEGTLVADRYRIESFLGSAAFSNCVRATDLNAQKSVCLKIIKNAQNSSKDNFDQALDEIKLLRMINSRADPDKLHFLRFFDAFYHREHMFIVTELLCDNLYEFLRKNRQSADPVYFTVGRIRHVAQQCLVALEFLHAVGIIHSDLKPENIVLADIERADIKIIDFGSSCFLHDTLGTYVQSRSYRAPEWSLGCILPELFTGKLLFDNESVSTMLASQQSILGNFDRAFIERGSFCGDYFDQHGAVYESRPKEGGTCILRPARSSLAIALDVPNAEGSELHPRLYADTDLRGRFVSLLEMMLCPDPATRPYASSVLRHPFFSP